MRKGDRRKAVIVVSSHVIRGSVGNRAAVFALESLGFPVWAVPTIVLPWHPGHGPSTRMVPPANEFLAMMRDLADSSWLGEVGAVLSGYLGQADQAGAVAMLVKAVKARNPDALYACDPVIGDTGGLYVAEATAAAIRDHLLPLADIATPNRAELSWLTGLAADDLTAATKAARAVGPATMLVTSAPVESPGRTGSLLVSANAAVLAEHRSVDRPPNGLGDLTGALLLARLLSGHSTRDALRLATASVYEILERAMSRGADELMLETDATSLATPGAEVILREHPVVELDHHLPSRPRRAIAGVDGCKAGWVAALLLPDGPLRIETFATMAELVDALPPDATIAVDMPIGLPETVGHGGRGPEALVRRHLGERQSSVFSIPSRSAVYAECAPFTTLDAWYEAHRRAKVVARNTSHPPRSISIQAFGIFSKIREIDGLLRERTGLAERLIESHPEAAFWRLAGRAMRLPKKIGGRVNPAGMEERKALLASLGIARAMLDAKPPRGAGEDDVLDACAMLMVAARHARGKAEPFPDPPARDAFGLPVAIWT
ncbi:MAG: pyridoxal kinase PdxY [Rhizobiaceae bacterium]|nr:pyridoxal kinase PdxY [Rhizobiaceae bacterium]MCV0407273.1 pyridoxal kinase PdxY [Rhizobiaceae bacterium]